MKIEKIDIVNESTGEIIGSRHIGEEDILNISVTAKNQKEYINNHVLNFQKGESFMKMFTNMSKYIHSELSNAEWMFFTRLTPYICYDDCILRDNGNRRGKPLSIQDVSDLLKESYKYCCRMFNALIKQQMIVVTYTGEQDSEIKLYSCNPFIFFRGKDLNKTIYSDFAKTKWGKFNSIIEAEYDDNSTHEE